MTIFGSYECNTPTYIGLLAVKVTLSVHIFPSSLNGRAIIILWFGYPV